MTLQDPITNHDTQPTVLVIDDELGPRESLRFLLKNEYRVLCADSVDHGLELLRDNTPDTVIMDIRMPGRNGIDGLREIRKNHPDLSVIMLTGFAAVGSAQEALRNEASDYIEKPFDATEMRSAVQRHVAQTRLRRRQERLRHETETLRHSGDSREAREKERLAELGQFSAEFVHDLRNTLAMVSGSSDLLRQEMAHLQRQSEHPSEVPGYLDMLERSMQQCVGMLNVWQRLIQQDPSLQTPLHIHELAMAGVKSCRPAAQAAQAELVFEPLGADVEVLGDRVQLTRAITNLIHNALHALPAANGLIRVRVERQDTTIRLSVRDNGCGIPPENMKRLFTPKFTTRRAQGGMGLGLFIVRKIAETHGGSLSVESILGQGTTFTLTLPISDPVTNAGAV